MLLASPLALTVDVEALIWTPGQLVTVPAMPSTPFDLARFNEILKAVYLPAVREMLNNSTILLRHLEGVTVETPLSLPDGLTFSVPLAPSGRRIGTAYDLP